MQTFRKIKRVKPIIKMKQRRVDEEAAVLEAVRAEKLKLVQSMKESQRKYMDGVETLNHVRGSRGRANLDTLEAGLDGVKAQWYRLYRDVQEAERKEKAQIAQLLAAERELKSIEKLLNRYEAEHKQQLGKAEQAMLDDVALRRFLANTRGERP